MSGNTYASKHCDHAPLHFVGSSSLFLTIGASPKCRRFWKALNFAHQEDVLADHGVNIARFFDPLRRHCNSIKLGETVSKEVCHFWYKMSCEHVCILSKDVTTNIVLSVPNDGSGMLVIPLWYLSTLCSLQKLFLLSFFPPRTFTLTYVRNGRNAYVPTYKHGKKYVINLRRTIHGKLRRVARAAGRIGRNARVVAAVVEPQLVDDQGAGVLVVASDGHPR